MLRTLTCHGQVDLSRMAAILAWLGRAYGTMAAVHVRAVPDALHGPSLQQLPGS